LPAVILTPLVSITKHSLQDLRRDHKKLLRLLYYHIHVLLGCGRAGTCGPKDQDDQLSAAMLPPHLMKECWDAFSQRIKDTAILVANLRLLSGILRGIRETPNKHKKSQQGRSPI